MARRNLVTPLFVAALLATTGCSLVGTWKTISTQPPEALETFPIGQITFDDRDLYSATEIRGDQTVTTTGKYRWNGWELIITPRGETSQFYQAHQNLFTRRLVISRRTDGKKVTASLARIDDASP